MHTCSTHRRFAVALLWTLEAIFTVAIEIFRIRAQPEARSKLIFHIIRLVIIQEVIEVDPFPDFNRVEGLLVYAFQYVLLAILLVNNYNVIWTLESR